MAPDSKKQTVRTKGKASARGKALPVEQGTKKQIALRRREARQKRIIWISVGALAVVILAIILAGVLQELVFEPSRPVAIVNGVKIRTTDYQDLVNHRRFTLHQQEQMLQRELSQLDPNNEQDQFLISIYEQQLSQIRSSLTFVPDSALDELIDHELIRQKAEELALTVTEIEIDQAIEEDLRQAASSSVQTPVTGTVATATPIPQERLDEIYRSALERMGLSEKAFRLIVRRSLLQDKVQEVLASQVPTTGLVIHLQLIKTDTEEQALAAQQRIEQGEDFAVVAREVSTDTLSAEDGGDLGWLTPEQLSSRYGPVVEAQALALEIGKLTLVKGENAFYLIRVVGRDENGPLPADVLAQRRNSALSDWLAQQKSSPDVQIERLLQPDQIPPDPYETPTATGP